MPTVYVYRRCSTCRAALEWLAGQGISFEERAIRETPPTVAELRVALPRVGGLKRLFNTSGLEYRSLGLKERLSSLGEEEALALLASNGMLVRRPLVIGDGFVLAGFRPEQWAAVFNAR